MPIPLSTPSLPPSYRSLLYLQIVQRDMRRADSNRLPEGILPLLEGLKEGRREGEKVVGQEKWQFLLSVPPTFPPSLRPSLPT